MSALSAARFLSISSRVPKNVTPIWYRDLSDFRGWVKRSRSHPIDCAH